MSTLKEIAESKVTLMIKEKEDFLLSASRDLVTFSFLALCIYISQGSNWWTLLTGIMFLVFGASKLSSKLSKSTTTFDSPEKAVEFLNKLNPKKD